MSALLYACVVAFGILHLSQVNPPTVDLLKLSHAGCVHVLVPNFDKRGCIEFEAMRSYALNGCAAWSPPGAA